MLLGGTTSSASLEPRPRIWASVEYHRLSGAGRGVDSVEDFGDNARLFGGDVRFGIIDDCIEPGTCFEATHVFKTAHGAAACTKVGGTFFGTGFNEFSTLHVVEGDNKVGSGTLDSVCTSFGSAEGDTTFARILNIKGPGCFDEEGSTVLERDETECGVFHGVCIGVP